MIKYKFHKLLVKPPDFEQQNHHYSTLLLYKAYHKSVHPKACI